MRGSSLLAAILAGLAVGVVARSQPPEPPKAAPATAPATAPAQADKLLAASLSHDARSLGHQRGDFIIARAGRIQALLGAAARLWGDSAEINQQLVALHEELGDLAKAAEAARRYQRARPRDFAMGVRMVRLSLALLDDADKRIALLQQIKSDDQLLDELRAFAAAELAGIYRRQGDNRRAKVACEEALKLDELELAALALQASAGTAPNKPLRPEDEFWLALAGVLANPRSVAPAWDAARLLQAAGLYDQALVLYMHADGLLAVKRMPADRMEKYAVDFFNAMLDAGKTQKGVQLFESLVGMYPRSRGLRALLVEAYRELAEPNKAKLHLNALRQIYKPLAAPEARRTPKQAAELAWFNLIFERDSQQALDWARKAAPAAGDDTAVQLALGAAELAMDQVDEGTKRLKTLVDKEPYAAAILAKHYFDRGDPDTARDIMHKGAGGTRSGPGFRALAAVARRKDMALPVFPRAAGMLETVTKVPEQVLLMGSNPNDFLTLKLVPPRTPLQLGEPVTVTVELENISGHTLPLGQEGLFAPILYLGIVVEGAASARFLNLTLVALPVPRYFRAGEKVSVSARVDVGPAQQLLMAHPLGELELTIGGILDPLQDGNKLFSSVPQLPVRPVTVVRKPLFDVAGGETAARYALGYIVRDLKQGDLRTQLRAARQTASLLGHICRTETGAAKQVLPQVLTKPILLSMTRAFVQAKSPAVRVAMLSALHHVHLDERIIKLLEPLVEDPSPVVRMRLIELLAVKQTSGHKTMLDLFAQDPDPLVRDMATALRKGK